MERASRTRSSGPPNATSVHTWCLALTRRNPDQVEEQCNDPKLMHCGLEKCVAADGSVEWVAAHSKVRLDPHLPPIAHSHKAPNARVAALSHHSQERFQLEGAKCLIWNQHSLEVSSR